MMPRGIMGHGEVRAARASFVFVLGFETPVSRKLTGTYVTKNITSTHSQGDASSGPLTRSRERCGGWSLQISYLVDRACAQVGNPPRAPATIFCFKLGKQNKTAQKQNTFFRPALLWGLSTIYDKEKKKSVPKDRQSRQNEPISIFTRPTLGPGQRPVRGPVMNAKNARKSQLNRREFAHNRADSPATTRGFPSDRQERTTVGV